MPREVIDRPNSAPVPSHIQDSVLDLAVKLDKMKIDDSDLKSLEEFRRAGGYIAASQCSQYFFSKETIPF